MGKKKSHLGKKEDLGKGNLTNNSQGREEKGCPGPEKKEKMGLIGGKLRCGSTGGRSRPQSRLSKTKA